MHKFYFNVTHRHTFLQFCLKTCSSSEFKKEFGMQVQSPESCCFKYHLLDSVLHLVNSANYNKRFTNKTNSLFSL